MNFDERQGSIHRGDLTSWHKGNVEKGDEVVLCVRKRQLFVTVNKCLNGSQFSGIITKGYNNDPSLSKVFCEKNEIIFSEKNIFYLNRPK